MPSREINHWWTTRPKRKIITVVDVLRVFLAIAEGKEWARNRELHLKFEEALEQQGIKGEGERRDQQGGGARTYAAWLFSFGLWFVDSNGFVRATFAGDDLAKGREPVPILTTQLLNFQYPSPYSQITRVNPRFRLFPFRFILRLLLIPKLNNTLSQEEIARFVITRAETERDLSSVAEAILSFRATGTEPELAPYGSLSKLKDTANTFINQLEFTRLIARMDGESRIFIPDEKRPEVEALFTQLPSAITRADEHEFFQRKYGLGPHHQRDDRRFGASTTVVSSHDAERSRVLLALYEILAYKPIKTIDNGVLRQISASSGVDQQEVERIISSVGVQPSYDQFEEKYLQLSVGERAFAKEFEQATEGIFGKEGLGFETEWIGPHPNNPDILAISTEGDPYVGIIDTKAYKEYTINGDHKRRMVHVYIPKYRHYRHNSSEVDLAFFSYIAAGFGSTINSGIQEIKNESSISGFCITARELLGLLREHRRSAFDKQELKRLFTLNKILMPSDFQRQQNKAA